MGDFGFLPFKAGVAPSVGSVLLLMGNDRSLLRITYLFERNAYVMSVTSPEGAREARKPYRLTIAQLNSWLEDGTAVVGRLPLSSEFLDAATTADEAQDALQKSLLAHIAPLVAHFEDEKNLASREFKARILARAQELQISKTTLRRLLLRYYYFGQLPAALSKLRPGRAPHRGSLPAAQPDSPRRRPGPKIVLEKELGPNNFVVSEEDIDDMVASVTASAKEGRSTLTEAWTDYLKAAEGKFATRHPELHKQFIDKKCPPPVTSVQFRTYVQAEGQYTEEIMAHMPALNPQRASGRGLIASGPGEIAEIDATGSRVFIVNSETGAEIGKPWIYILIDRWSRFILGVYVTANSPSWEELKQVLLISFTARSKRFKPLSIHVDEVRWSVGRVPTMIVQDRGSDFMSNNMATATVDNLRIQLKTAPRRCPDAKGIGERVIRELKHLMVAEGLKGSFTKRPMDYDTKLKAKKAKAATAHFPVDIYRALVRVVDKHNNKPHRTLEKYNALRAAGVPPTPREAYVWGLANLTGIRSPPLTDDDYFRLLLTTGHGSLGNGKLNFESRSYFPANEPAQRLARSYGNKRKPIDVRFDRRERNEVHVPMSDGPWARWLMSERERAAAQVSTLGAKKLQASKSKLNKVVTKVAPTPKKDKSGPSDAPATPQLSWQELERQERALNIQKAREKLCCQE